MPREDFKTIEEITDKDHIVSVPITCREFDNGIKRYSCAIQREYVKDGQVQKTYWLQVNHVRRLQQILSKVIERLEEEEEKAKLEFYRQDIK